MVLGWLLCLAPKSFFQSRSPPDAAEAHMDAEGQQVVQHQPAPRRGEEDAQGDESHVLG